LGVCLAFSGIGFSLLVCVVFLVVICHPVLEELV
jgi:hypothetical protein